MPQKRSWKNGPHEKFMLGVKQFGNHWIEVAKFVGHEKTSRNCYQYYQDMKGPNKEEAKKWIERHSHTQRYGKKWTDEEKTYVLQAREQGIDWETIATNMPMKSRKNIRDWFCWQKKKTGKTYYYHTIYKYVSILIFWLNYHY